MRKIAILLLILLFAYNQIWAKQVELVRAQKVAATFLANQENLKSISVQELIPVFIKLPGEGQFHKMKSTDNNKNQLVYLFKNNDQGFVLVSGDDLARPILGYSTSEKIDENNLPVNMLKWVEAYKKQIRFLKNNPNLKSQSISTEWKLLENGKAIEKVSSSAVSPLMTTKWDQSPLYNDLCPQKNSSSPKAVTGCVATAMAQIMKYHNYPKNGEGIHSYYHSNESVTYGNLTANFGATTYDWANMPNALTQSSLAIQKKAVATLMLHCGVGVDMNYSPEGSGAFVIEEKSYGRSCAEKALKDFFGYKQAYGVERETMTTNQWIELLKTELNGNRPILFAGFGRESGHAFVADGYDNNNYFHMNWGWSGYADGYYSVDAFEPKDLGTGAGNGVYNDNQCVVIGIQPPKTTSGEGFVDLRLYSEISVPQIYQLNQFRIDVDVANFGDKNATNLEVAAALFDDDGDFVEFIETFGGLNLDAGYFNSLWFDNDGLSAYPNTYYIGLYYKQEGDDWVAFGNGEYKNFIKVEILSPFGDSDIKMYSKLNAPDLLIQGEAVELTVDIANFGNSTYYGEFGVGLFTLQGDAVQTIDVQDIGSLNAGYYKTYSFNNHSIDAEPGAYLIALVHFPNGGSNQEVIAPNNFINPVQVNVASPPTGPDVYENNNSLENATTFNVEFQDNYDGFYTLNTNIHSESDIDYYTIDLEKGFDYTILARVHDSFSSSIENQDYTCDVIWAHSDNGEWSKMYDDEMDNAYVLKDGGQVYFGVIPYFEGIMGTYSFQIEIARSIHTNVDEKFEQESVLIYPNPVKNTLHVRSNNIVNQFELINNEGKQVYNGNSVAKTLNIDVSTLASGLYFLKLYQENEVLTKKIMINE